MIKCGDYDRVFYSKCSWKRKPKSCMLIKIRKIGEFTGYWAYYDEQLSCWYVFDDDYDEWIKAPAVGIEDISEYEWTKPDYRAYCKDEDYKQMLRKVNAPVARGGIYGLS